MSIPNKPDEYLGWTVEDTGRDAEELSGLLVSAAFWKKWGNKTEILDTDAAIERAVAEAKVAAMSRVSDIDELPQRALLLMMMDAKKHGWHRNLITEHDTVADLVASVVEGGSSSDCVRRDLLFITEVMWPAFKRAGVDMSELVDVKDKWSKIREIIPYVRPITDRIIKAESDDVVREASDNLKTVIDLVNSDLSVRQLRKELQRMKIKNHPVAIPEVYQVASDRYILVVDTDNQTLVWLAKIMNFSIADCMRPVRDLVNKVRSLI